MDNSVDDDDDGATRDDDDGFTHLAHLDLVLGGKFVAFTHVCSQFVRQSLNSAYRHFKRVTRFFPLPFLIPLEAILSLLLGFQWKLFTLSIVIVIVIMLPIVPDCKDSGNWLRCLIRWRRYSGNIKQPGYRHQNVEELTNRDAAATRRQPMSQTI